MTVWMSTLRRGLVYHLLREDQRFTVCGRPSFSYGHTLTLEAVRELKANLCRTCAGENPGFHERPNLTGKAA